jgi:hypothetical protein
MEKGMKYRFRYREEWVPVQLLENTAIMNTLRGIIVFYDTKTKEFFPIIDVTINQVEKLGDVLYFEFTTCNLIRYESRKDRTNEYNSIIKKYIQGEHFDGETGKLTKFVFHINKELSEFVTDNDLSSWIAILNKICNLDPFLVSVFFRILRMTNSKGNTIKPREVNSQTREVGYVLRGHETYRLEVFQRARNNFPAFGPFRLNLFFIKDHITPIKESDVVVGKYDKLQLALLTKWRKSDVGTIIGLKGDEGSGLDIPEIYIPLKITKDVWRLIGSISMSAIGIVTAIASGYVPQVLSMPPTIISPLLSVLGAVLFALGVAWLRPMYE